MTTLHLTPDLNYQFRPREKNPIWRRAFLVALLLHIGAYILFKVQPLLFTDSAPPHAPVVVESVNEPLPTTASSLHPHKTGFSLPPPPEPKVRGPAP